MGDPKHGWFMIEQPKQRWMIFSGSHFSGNTFEISWDAWDHHGMFGSWDSHQRFYAPVGRVIYSPHFPPQEPKKAESQELLETLHEPQDGSICNIVEPFEGNEDSFAHLGVH